MKNLIFPALIGLSTISVICFPLAVDARWYGPTDIPVPAECGVGNGLRHIAARNYDDIGPDGYVTFEPASSISIINPYRSAIKVIVSSGDDFYVGDNFFPQGRHRIIIAGNSKTPVGFAGVIPDFSVEVYRADCPQS